MQEPLLIDSPLEEPLGVLLVEDSPADARLVEEELREHDEVVLSWVRSLKEARETLAVKRFDAVLLDLLLPDARGVDLIEGVRGLAGDAALLVLSGQSPDDLLLARAAIRKGAEDFLPKGARAPFLLPRMITTAVERRRRAGLSAGEAEKASPVARAEEAKRLVTTTNDGSWSCRIASGDLELSAGAARLVGLTAVPREMPLKGLLDALPAPSGRALLRLWARLRRGQDKTALMLFDDAPPRPGTAPQDILIEGRARRDAEGRIVAIDGALFDVTSARRLDRLHDAIITQLAHELRTPLTTIRAVLGLLQGGGGEPMPHGSGGLLGRAVQNADRLAQILDDLLVHAPPPGHGRSRRQNRRQNRRAPLADLSVLHDLVSQAVAAYQPQAQSTGISLLLDVAGPKTDPGRDPAAKADADAVRPVLDGEKQADVALVIEALLADALRRAAPEGQVRVAVVPDGDGARLTVEASTGPQTGPQTGDARTGDAQSGAAVTAAKAARCDCRLDGRHLAILERLIERVGGRLVESPGPAGAAWRVALPLAARA